MFTCIAIASALTIGPVQKPVANSIEFFDSKLRVTERVLDRTICPEIQRVQAVDRSSWENLTPAQRVLREQTAESRKVGQRGAMERHCRNSVRVGKNQTECNLN